MEKLNKELQIFEGIENQATYSSLINIKNAVVYLDESYKILDKKIEMLSKAVDNLHSIVMVDRLDEVKKQ